MNVYHIFRIASPFDSENCRRPTGVKDEVGREICEGDIVEYTDALWEVNWCGREYRIVNPD